MGQAVSSVTSLVSSGNGFGNVGGNFLGGNLLQNLGNPGAFLMGQGMGDANSAIATLIPQVPIASQADLQTEIGRSNALVGRNINSQDSAQNLANQSYGNANAYLDYGQNSINQAQNNIGMGQGAVQNAVGLNQGYGSNVNNALSLSGQTAAGGGPAQQAANAQLQQGTNAAVASQHALANSGNLSQMIGGQKSAMENAAMLQQQNALNAAGLQAQMAGNAQGQFISGSGQQAAQGAQNAGLQQVQTAQQQAQTGAEQSQATQQANLFSTAQGAAGTFGGLANAAEGNAITGQLGGLGIEQQALGQTAQYRAQALGGMMGGAGGAAGALISDKSLKKDIKDADSEVDDFFRALKSKKFSYKQPSGESGQTQGSHLGILAQDVEKSEYGKSMIKELPEGKAIDIASAVGALMAHASTTIKKVDALESSMNKKSKMTRKDLEYILKNKGK